MPKNQAAQTTKYTDKDLELAEKVIKQAELGVVGTDIFAGYFDEDYQEMWQDLYTRTQLIEEMKGSDATINQILDAMKNPILSAKYFIKCEDEELKQFAERAFFKELNCGFKELLEQILFMLDYGFSVFEKVYKFVDGVRYWDKISPRLQKSIQEWRIENKGFINDRPSGITQVKRSTDETDQKAVTFEIPWERLLVFTHRRQGNNYEGKSVLRSAYIHWKIKTDLYRIAAIAAERFGVGVPFAKVKKGTSDKVRKELQKLLRNIRANEYGNALIDENVEEFDILMPKGSGSHQVIMSQVEHHDKKLYDAVSAGFLNLSTGDGGSNALSKDLSSFFLNNLVYVNNHILEVLNSALQELVTKNFGEVEFMPELCSSDIGSISLDEFTNAMAAAKEKGLVTWNKHDEDKYREQAKMPALPKEDSEDRKTDALEQELIAFEFEVNSVPDEDEGPEQEQMQEAKKLSKEIEAFQLATRAPMSQETKDKIAEALRKKSTQRSQNTIAGRMATDEQAGKLNRAKQMMLTAIENIRERLAEHRAKAASMSKKEKRTFNKAMKETIERLKEMKRGFIDRRININKKIKERKKEVGAKLKEDKLQAKIKKAQDREEKRRNKIFDAIEKLKGRLKKAKGTKARNKIIAQIQEKEASIDKGFKFAKPKVTEREKVFTRNVSDFENYLESEFGKILDIVEPVEIELRAGLRKFYEKADTFELEGKQYLENNANNEKVIDAMNKFIDTKMERLDKQLIDSTLQKRMFKNVVKMSKKNLLDNKKLLAEEIEVDDSQLRSFIRGYISNVRGTLFNTPRQIKEEVELNFGSKTDVRLATDQLENLRFNRNILKLSTITHPRGAYNAILFDDATRNDIQLFKVVVPTQRLKDVNQFGITAGVLFGIYTAEQLNEKINNETDGRTPNAISGLGLHHNAFTYSFPIVFNELEDEEQIAKDQRRAFKESFEEEPAQDQ